MANMARDLLKEKYQYAYDKDREQLTYQVIWRSARAGAKKKTIGTLANTSRARTVQLKKSGNARVLLDVLSSTTTPQ